jgi:hypothetical protein
MTRRLAIAFILLGLGTPRGAADAPLAPALPPDLSGTWSGYWISDSNGHRGPLQATFTKISDTCYRVRFRGRFAAVVPFRYTTTLTVVGTGDGLVVLSGSQVLGPVLGTFSTDAVATATTFEASFRSKNDCGRFVLWRCGCR